MRIIGIAGYAKTGKDTVARFLASSQGGTTLHFAEPLKQGCAILFGIPKFNFYNYKLKEKKDEFWDLSPREIAQKVGTELFRKNYGEDFWLKRMEQEILTLAPAYRNLICIADVRFQNEVDWIFARGGVLIHLLRKGCDGNVGIPGHASEAGFKVPADKGGSYYVIHNDGDLESLYTKVHSVYRSLYFGSLT